MTSWYPHMEVLNTSSPVATGTSAPAASPAEDGSVRRHEQCRRPVRVAVCARRHRCAVASTTTASPRMTVCRTAPVNVRPAYGVLRLRLASRAGSTTVVAAGSKTNRLAAAPGSTGPPCALWPA